LPMEDKGEGEEIGKLPRVGGGGRRGDFMKAKRQGFI